MLFVSRIHSVFVDHNRVQFNFAYVRTTGHVQIGACPSTVRTGNSTKNIYFTPFHHERGVIAATHRVYYTTVK